MTTKFLKGILASAVIITSCDTAQIDTKSDLNFNNKVQNWLSENNVPAAGIGIIEDGKVKYANVIGELKKDIPAPDNAIFNIASLTKPVVAMLTLKLVENGQWDLDEPLFHYWIDPDISNDPLHKKLTTRHVLRHQTGFTNWRRMNQSGKLTFEFEPGTDYKYSGEGFEYLRKALESKFKKSFMQLSDSVLFKPLDMEDTRYYWDKNMDESRFAFWHDYKGNLYSPATSKSYGLNAAGSLLTTVGDYCKFGIDVINGSELSADILNEMISSENNSTKSFEQGLSWEIVRNLPGGEYALVHGGTDNGVNAVCIFLPHSKRGVVVFTNGDNGRSIWENVIKEIIGDEIFDCIYKISNIPERVTLSNEILEKYVGEYQDQYGRGLIVSISKEAGAIKVAGDGIGTFTLYPEAEGKFFQEYSEIKYDFILDNDNNIEIQKRNMDGRIINRARMIK